MKLWRIVKQHILRMRLSLVFSAQNDSHLQSRRVGEPVMAADPQCGCKGSRICRVCGAGDIAAEQVRLMAVKRVRFQGFGMCFGLIVLCSSVTVSPATALPLARSATE